MSDSLLLDTRLIAQTLNVERIAAISGDETDLEKPEYQRLKSQLSAIGKANERYRFVYLMGRRSDRQVFISVDNKPPDSEDYSPPGDLYHEASDSDRRIFATGGEVIDGPVVDRWGTWVFAQAPIFEPSQAVQGNALPADARAGGARGSARRTERCLSSRRSLCIRLRPRHDLLGAAGEAGFWWAVIGSSGRTGKAASRFAKRFSALPCPRAVVGCPTNRRAPSMEKSSRRRPSSSVSTTSSLAPGPTGARAASLRCSASI